MNTNICAASIILKVNVVIGTELKTVQKEHGIKEPMVLYMLKLELRKVCVV